MALDELQSGAISRPEADITDLTVPGGPNGDVAVRIVKPVGTRGPLPVVLFIHGAGWVFGDTITHDRLIREMAVGAGAAWCSLTTGDLRRPAIRRPLRSATPWPPGSPTVAPSMVWTRGIWPWPAIRSAVTSLPRSRLLAKQRSGPTFVAQVLFYPVTNGAFDTGSYRKFAEGYHLRRDAMMWFWDLIDAMADSDAAKGATAQAIQFFTNAISSKPPMENGEAK